MRFFRIPSFVRTTHRRFIWNVPGSQKSIYLTFDDGPTQEATGWIMETLSQFKAKATFFCVGNNVRMLPQLYNRLVEEGHSVGNHTFNHCKGLKMSIKEYVDDVVMASDYIKSDLIRPPYGTMRGRQARELIKRGYKIVMWNVLTYDFDQSLTPEYVLEKSIKLTEPGSIIVFHDNIKSFNTLKKVLPAYLEHFSRQGYSFRALNY